MYLFGLHIYYVLYLKTQLVPCSKHCPPLLLQKKNNNLMLYKAEATVFSEFKLKHKNIICGYNVDFLNVKTFTACSNIDFKRLI